MGRSPFSVFTGLALVWGYALLGAGWLVMKTEGELQARLYRFMLPLAASVVAAIAMVSLWTPLLDAEIAQRWFSWPNIALLSPVPILVAVTALALYRAIICRREVQPFVLSLVLFVLCYAGLSISLFPAVIPPGITIWDAAAPPESLGFSLAGTLIVLPIILAYTGYTYWIFRGKVRPEQGYH
jgi:cytochrome d ubiquinol oxidase subunit II